MIGMDDVSMDNMDTHKHATREQACRNATRAHEDTREGHATDIAHMHAA